MNVEIIIAALATERRDLSVPVFGCNGQLTTDD
jgi:hypothetical protein